MEVPLQNPPQCRVCGELGHRTPECLQISGEDNSFEIPSEINFDKQMEEDLRLEEERSNQRKEAPKAMEVDVYRRGRGPVARAEALMEKPSAAGAPKHAAKPAAKKLARTRWFGTCSIFPYSWEFHHPD